MSLLKSKSFSRIEASIFLKMLSETNSREAQISASFYFRKKLAACQAPPNDLLDSIVSELIYCLRRVSPEIQLNASWALTNLACGSQYDTHRIVNKGGLSGLRNLVESTHNLEVRNQALWAIGNIAADCQDCRELVRKENLLILLIRFLECPDYLEFNSRKIAIWCLVNVLRSGMIDICIQDIRRLLFLLHQTIVMFCNDEILCDAIWCVAYLVDHTGVNDERITSVFAQPGLLDSITMHLKSSSTRVLSGSLRVIGNIITEIKLNLGTDEQTTRMLDYNILEDLSVLMNSSTPQISRESIWILSNIAAGTEEHVTRLFSVRGMAENIFQHCKDNLLKKRKEAFWVLINSNMGASLETFDLLMGNGIAHIFFHILREITDFTMIERTLHSIGHALRERPERREYTKAVFSRVGIKDELLKIATNSYNPDTTFIPEGGFNSIKIIATSFLREYFNILPPNNSFLFAPISNEEFKSSIRLQTSAPICIRIKKHL